MFLNVTKLYYLIPIVMILVELMFLGYHKKKSIYPLLSLVMFILLLIIHMIQNHFIAIILPVIICNVLFDFFGIIVSVVSYIVLDEIETRRSRINEVFEEKYKDE